MMEGSGELAIDYPTLIAAFRRRKAALRLTDLEIDELGGMQSGYWGKISCGMKNLGPLSMGRVLVALDVALVVLPTNHILSRAEYAAEYQHLQARQGKGKIKNRKLQAHGAKGGRKRWTLWTDGKRRKHIKAMCEAARKARIKRLVEAGI